MGVEDATEDKATKYVFRLVSIAYDADGNVVWYKALLLIPLAPVIFFVALIGHIFYAEVAKIERPKQLSEQEIYDSLDNGDPLKNHMLFYNYQLDPMRYDYLYSDRIHD